MFSFIVPCTLTVVLTGHVGAGKSAAGNFFVGETVFKAKRSFGGVTTVSAAATAIIAQESVQIIDTPGFMDALSPETFDFKELAHALVLARNGVHAFGLLIDVSKRYDQKMASSIKELLLGFKEIIPYIFVLFTKAGDLQDEQLQITMKDEQALRAEIEKMLCDPKCPPQLLKLLQLTDWKYMTLETKHYNKQSDYSECKCNELVAHINRIQENNGRKTLHFGLMTLAQVEFEKSSKRKKDGEKDVIMQDTTSNLQSEIEKAAEELKIEWHPGGMGAFWNLVTNKLLLQAFGTVVGAVLGASVGRPVAGAFIGQNAGMAAGKLANQSSCIQQ